MSDVREYRGHVDVLDQQHYAWDSTTARRTTHLVDNGYLPVQNSSR